MNNFGFEVHLQCELKIEAHLSLTPSPSTFQARVNSSSCPFRVVNKNFLTAGSRDIGQWTPQQLDRTSVWKSAFSKDVTSFNQRKFRVTTLEVSFGNREEQRARDKKSQTFLCSKYEVHFYANCHGICQNWFKSFKFKLNPIKLSIIRLYHH